jgi:sarcosine oxidase subunit beta
MKNSATADVIIIGAGIVGCAIFHELASHTNLRIVMVDQGKLASGTTGQSGGLVRVLKIDDHLQQLALQSFAYYQQFEQHTGLACPFTKTGVVYLSSKPADAIDLRLVPKDLLGICPHAQALTGQYAAYEEEAGYINPTLACKNWVKAAKLKNNQAKVYEQLTGVRLWIDQAKVHGISTPQGNIMADKVIIAAGAGSLKLLNQLGDEPIGLEIKSFQYNIYKNELTLPTIIDYDRDIYIIPQDHGSLLAGFLSLDKTITTSSSLMIDPCLAKAITTVLSQILPHISSQALLASRISVDAFTHNEQPLIKPSDKVKGLYLATGLSSGGIKLAPAIAQKIANMMALSD